MRGIIQFVSFIFIIQLPFNAGYGLAENETNQLFLKLLNKTKIRENLEYLTKNPHVSGNVHNNHLADYIASKWEKYGFDSVEKVVYEVLLSFPDPENPNKVHLLGDKDEILYTTQHIENHLRPEDKHDDVIPMYNSFSPNGTVEGELVYVNFGRPEDFKHLIQLGVNFTNKIVIARYGQNYRGNKVNLASQYGAVGIILFSDPYHYAQEGEDHVYPHSRWLPGSGAQRGSLKTRMGDSLTLDYPALHDVYRISHAEDLPTIPCQPIGYHDAKHLLKHLGGFAAPKSWNFNYNIGPGFKNNNTTKKVRLTVNNHLQLTNITNVIGIIKGDEEADRYVLAGNHRDAWGFGAVDASSGTAQLIEVTRVFGKMLKQGWRPRRTLVFCSWDAEEFGLIGSFEWVEDNLVKLTHRAVAYVNTDSCVSDDLFGPHASPFLISFLVNITKLVPSPVNESQSLYDSWYHDSTRHGQIKPNGEIKVRPLRGGTDHVPFFAFAGVAGLNFAFETDNLKYQRGFSSFPAYHSAYDTFHLVDNYIDPEYRRMAACGHLNLFALYQLAETDILPYNMSNYRDAIFDGFLGLQTDGTWDTLLNISINSEILDAFNASVHNFIDASKDWEQEMDNFNSTDPLIIRSVNDQLMQIDKAFIKPQGIPLQPQYKHVIFSMNFHNSYGISSFPGIRDLLHEIISHPVVDDPRITLLERHISDVRVSFHTATNLLKPTYIV